MKSISQLWSFKLNKEGYEFIDEVAEVNNAWGLFLAEYRTKENEEKRIFKLDVEPKYVGMVAQYKNGHYECNLNSIDFQAEYTEDELKKVIIKDIKQEVLETEYEENRKKIKEFYETNWVRGIRCGIGINQ